jgi:hypothetical protein
MSRDDGLISINILELRRNDTKKETIFALHDLKQIWNLFRNLEARTLRKVCEQARHDGKPHQQTLPRGSCQKTETPRTPRK